MAAGSNFAGTVTSSDMTGRKQKCEKAFESFNNLAYQFTYINNSQKQTYVTVPEKKILTSLTHPLPFFLLLIYSVAL